MLQYIRDKESVTGFMDSIYFAIITYGTIGFGDVTPQSMDFTQAMEVLRVLMFASAGLALVSLCFSLYREAADNNMKVITKKMSVLPQRISTVQREFIGQLQKSRQRTINRSLSEGGSKWNRVVVRDVLEARSVKSEGDANGGGAVVASPQTSPDNDHAASNPFLRGASNISNNAVRSSLLDSILKSLDEEQGEEKRAGKEFLAGSQLMDIKNNAIKQPLIPSSKQVGIGR